MPDRLTLAAALVALSLAQAAGAAELLFGTEGNRLRRFDVDTLGNPKPLHDVLIESASDGETGGPGPTTPGGRDINGMICRFPDGSGRFLAGEDTGQVAVRPGWGVFDAGANQSASSRQPISRTSPIRASASRSAAPSIPRVGSSPPKSARRTSAPTTAS